MKTALAFALLLGVLVPALASPAAPGGKQEPSAFRVVQLQKPDADAVAEALRSVSAQPRLRAPASPGAAAPVGSPVVDSRPGSRILHGEEAEDCQFPYQVALHADSRYFCGGSLIAKDWVLTAAHCIPDGVKSIIVYAGDVLWREATVQSYASRAIIHGGYNYWAHNDIALLKLGEDIEEEDCIKAIDLETDGCATDDLDGEDAVVSGWGLISDSSNSVESHLRFVETRIVSNDYCAYYYGYTIIDSGICSISPINANGTLCSGDSGGPLVWKETGRQIGINSFVSTYGCEAGWPSGYARVPCFTQWIEAGMKM